MELTYTNRIIENEAFILLNEDINFTNSAMIAEEMYWHHAQGLKITVKINSVGGNVMAGYNIIDAIKQTNADTHIIGVAASMAGIISQFGKRRMANNNAVIMIHPPSGTDNDLKEIMRASLGKMLTERSKLSEEEVTNMLKDDSPEVFMDAQEMLSKGLVDEIVETNHPKAVANDAKEYFYIYNKYVNNKSTKMDFTKIKNTLELADNATEDRVVEKIKDLKNDLEDTKTKQEAAELAKSETEKELKEVKAKLASFQESQVKDLIENAVKEGRIEETGKEKWTDLANKDFALAKQTLESISVAPQHSADYIEVGKEKKKFKDMTPEEKADLARKDPKVYNKMILEK
jgi:ATP-dependent protease ClpP protease subunit